MKHPNSRTIIKLRFKKCVHKNTSFRKFHVICCSYESIEFSVCFLTNTLNINIKFWGFYQNWPLRKFFALEDFIVKFAISMLKLSWLLRSRWNLSWFAFILLLANHVNSFWARLDIFVNTSVVLPPTM